MKFRRLIFPRPGWPALLLVLGSWLACAPVLFGQGCISVRGGGQCSLMGNYGQGDEHGYAKPGDWQVSLNYRWAYSDRHFIGDKEFLLPKQLNAEAINTSHNIDLTVLYALSSRFSIGLTLPFTEGTRSTTYEHDNVNRRVTSAAGIADMRVTAYYWLLDPATNPKGNISIGIGPKFPTGDYNAQDVFYTVRGPEVRAVDPSIQPGDGGFGFSAEFLAFREFTPRWSGYAQAFYLFNPQNTNGVPVAGGPPGGNPVKPVTSIADQYSARLGASFVIMPAWGLSLSLGPRIDGVPAEDALGASDGFRRPGITVSIEPGLTWMNKDWSVSLTAPVAIYRNRVRSVEDDRITTLTSTYHAGDAAFADFFITLNVSRRF